MNSEKVYGQVIADQLFGILIKDRMRVGQNFLIGELCREGFILRLAELLDIGITITETEVVK